MLVARAGFGDAGHAVVLLLFLVLQLVAGCWLLLAGGNDIDPGDARAGVAAVACVYLLLLLFLDLFLLFYCSCSHWSRCYLFVANCFNFCWCYLVLVLMLLLLHQWLMLLVRYFLL